LQLINDDKDGQSAETPDRLEQVRWSTGSAYRQATALEKCEMSSGNGVLAGFKADYERIFVKEWSPFAGVILLLLVIISLMVSGQVWGVFGGVRFWGDWINNLIGLGPVLGIPRELDGLLTHRTSLMNILLVVGAFTAALLARQFSPSRPPKLEYVWAALGGSMMGIGAALAGGCTVGGFFNPVLHSSPAGWMMAAGLLIGSALGVKLLLWTLDNIEWGMEPPPTLKVPASIKKAYPLLGALAIGIPIAALLFQKNIIDPYAAIPPAFWIGSLLGGIIFGVGMIFAGGCASGTLWRMGEGHLKLWVTMFFFAWIGSIASALFKLFKITAIDETNLETYEMTSVGFQAFLPEMVGGWRFTLLVGGGLLLLWYVLVRYNESTEKFTLF